MASNDTKKEKKSSRSRIGRAVGSFSGLLTLSAMLGIAGLTAALNWQDLSLTWAEDQTAEQLPPVTTLPVKVKTIEIKPVPQPAPQKDAAAPKAEVGPKVANLNSSAGTDVPAVVSAKPVPPAAPVEAAKPTPPPAESVAAPKSEPLPAPAESVAAAKSPPAAEATKPATPAPVASTSAPATPAPATSASATPSPAQPPTAAASEPQKVLTAKMLFSAVQAPSAMANRSIGSYAKGCLAGAEALPVNGTHWQIMRISRNRNWGHASLVKFIEKFADDAFTLDAWPGLLVGDMSQPRGGPMPTGHASHQIGLDVDIWYKPMPDHVLSRDERNKLPLESVLEEPTRANTDAFTYDLQRLVRRAGSYSNVERIFVHPAIKKLLCEETLEDREVLRKIRPFWGHDDHFHVRLACPADSGACQNQAPPASDDGCGSELDHWLKIMNRPVAPKPAAPTPAVTQTAAATPAPHAETKAAAAPAPAATAHSSSTPTTVAASSPSHAPSPAVASTKQPHATTTPSAATQHAAATKPHGGPVLASASAAGLPALKASVPAAPATGSDKSASLTLPKVEPKPKISLGSLPSECLGVLEASPNPTPAVQQAGR